MITSIGDKGPDDNTDLLTTVSLKKLASLDLSKAYGHVNRSNLMWDCDYHLPDDPSTMVCACLQPFIVKTKPDFLGTTESQKLRLIKGSSLSPIMWTEIIGEKNFLPTADDVIFHPRAWE